MGEDGTRPRARRSHGPAARVDPPAAVGGYRLLTPHDPVAGRVRQEGEGVGRPDARVTGWIFAGERRLDQPMDRHLFDKWLYVAEKKAKLPKLEGGLWHP